MSHWYQAMELSHSMLMAGLLRKLGPDGDLNAAYRVWYRDHQERKWAEISRVHAERSKQQPETSPSCTSRRMPFHQPPTDAFTHAVGGFLISEK